MEDRIKELEDLHQLHIDKVNEYNKKCFRFRFIWFIRNYYEKKMYIEKKGVNIVFIELRCETRKLHPERFIGGNEYEADTK